MAIAVGRRGREEDECENMHRKVRRTRERQDTAASPCLQNHFTENEENIRKPVLSQTRVDFDFGPPILNLYQYVFEESHFLWSEAKDMCILRSGSEPQKGLLLFHTSGINLSELCWKQFEFDPHSTSFSTGKGSCQTDKVCVFYIGEQLWKNTTAVTLLKQENIFQKYTKSHIFFITESDEAREQAVRFTKETKCCPSTHVFQAASDKAILYDKMYEILQNQLTSLLSDLNSRTSTRLVHKFTSKLESFLGKLRSRKNRQRSALTKQCLSKIKSGFEFGIVGHRLCGNVLYIFEEDKMSDPQKRRDFHESIEETFKGDVQYKPIREVLSPHCVVKCGGPLKNDLTGRMGTIGIFGKLIDPKLGSSQENNNLIALSSGHVIHENTNAVLSISGRIGVCIWPANSVENILDVSVIKIDQSLIGSVEGIILDEVITVGEIPKHELGYQRVFKYGATTGRTDGCIGVIDDFQMFGEDVMTILPRRSGCPNGLFSDKGDSGAIVLTRYKGKLHGIGVIYGGCLILPDCRNIREETIAVFLRRAMDRFTSAKQRTIELNRI